MDWAFLLLGIISDGFPTINKAENTINDLENVSHGYSQFADTASTLNFQDDFAVIG